MIYPWCTTCAGRVCLSEALHRQQKAIEWRADFMLGGRQGRRLRKLFPTKKDAEAFEYITLADYKRGLYLPRDTSKTSLNEFLDGYIEKRVRIYLNGYKCEEYRFRAFREALGNRSLASLTTLDWDGYVKMRLGEGIGRTTLNRELTSFKTAFKWGTNNGFLKTNPFEKCVKFKEENVKVRWLNDAEIEDILTECTRQNDLGLRDILVVALNTGFRMANLMQITANDINNQRISAKKTKSGKEYQVPINKELANVLNRLISKNPSGPLLDFSNFRRRFDSVIKEPSVTLHTFRHTFGAQCLKRGIPIDRVCAWMGHHSVEFTRSHYGHLCPNQEAIEINLLNLGSKKILHNTVDTPLTTE